MAVSMFNTFCYIWMGVAIVACALSFIVTAPYGRHARKGWGLEIPNKLGWVIMELPSLLLFSGLFLLGYQQHNPVMWVFFAAWVLHYTNRSIVFPFRTKTTGKSMPLTIALSAIGFNGVNGFINGYWLGVLMPTYPGDWFTDPRFIIGLLVFAAGMIINIQSDNILLSLRKPGETGYKIPQGGWFKWVSCPNHLGEMIEWVGFAVMTWSLPAATFAIWTIANLLPRAIDHHKWYKNKFDNYPINRKAVFPGIL